ncbi:MAG: CPBP family intramembrane glutamic endopeptidase, partial [Bacteroidota bacterium]
LFFSSVSSLYQIKNIKRMKTMKSIWNKVPAWARALIFMFILGFPVIKINQGTASFNLQNYPSWGWGLLVVIVVLFVFWKLVSLWSPFKRPEDVKIIMQMNFKDIKVWSRMIGLILLTMSAAVLFTGLFGVSQEHGADYFERIGQFGDLTAVPLLIGVALTAGIVEEVIFRGYVQNTLVRAYPKAIVFLVIGLLFAMVHFLPLPLVVAFIIISIGFSLVADEFKSLGVVIFAHAIVDIISTLAGYYGSTDETGPVGLAIAAVVFVISLVLILKGNKALYFRKFRTSKLTQAS